MTLFAFLCSCALAATATAAKVQNFAPTYTSARKAANDAQVYAPTARHFTYRDHRGRLQTAPVVAHPFGKIDRRLNPTLISAATIAQERAHARSRSRCWRYVKEALLAAGAVDSYPKTALAKEAADELVNDYGFERLPVTDPYAAPVGAVLVYTAKGAPGHVELRTRTGFVSDFQTATPSKRKLVGIYAKG